MSLCLTLHINLGLSLRKTSQALKDLYNIQISHQQIANYCKTAAVCIKPFVDQYPYHKGETFIADETYIKVRGVKTYVWLIMNAACRSIIGYQVSDNRGVGPCILAMRMAFQGLKTLPEHFQFIADGYSAYPLAAMEFSRKFDKDFTFQITQVLELSNDNAVSKEYRPFKQIVKRLSRVHAEPETGARDWFLAGSQGRTLSPRRAFVINICNFLGSFEPVFSARFFIDHLPLPSIAITSCIFCFVSIAQNDYIFHKRL